MAAALAGIPVLAAKAVVAAATHLQQVLAAEAVVAVLADQAVVLAAHTPCQRARVAAWACSDKALTAQQAHVMLLPLGLQAAPVALVLAVLDRRMVAVAGLALTAHLAIQVATVQFASSGRATRANSHQPAQGINNA